jgi:hypothetical protein
MWPPLILCVHVTTDTEVKEQGKGGVMHFWVHGWDWGWLILLIVWVFLLAAASYVAMEFTTRRPRHRH